MRLHLSLIVITKNSEELLKDTLDSVQGIVEEIIIIDNGSTDRTLQIAKRFHAKIFSTKTESFSELRKYGLQKAGNEWILSLDSDEQLSGGLKKEIKEISNESGCSGFFIPRKAFLFGKPLSHGGEKDSVLRLFRKDSVEVVGNKVHEKYVLLKVKSGTLHNLILHYSYRSFYQILKKFTQYARLQADDKYQNGEKTTFRNLLLHPIHMFWARFIEDKGYKDGLFRIPLDLAFGYMEFLTYYFLLLKMLRSNSRK